MSIPINCPFCNGEILSDAKKCKHCTEWLTSQDIKKEIEKREDESILDYQQYQNDLKKEESKNANIIAGFTCAGMFVAFTTTINGWVDKEDHLMTWITCVFIGISLGFAFVNGTKVNPNINIDVETDNKNDVEL